MGDFEENDGRKRWLGTPKPYSSPVNNSREKDKINVFGRC
jgi:hypothetical protein